MGEKSLGFFRAISNSQTYLNMLYLFFSFPLGLIYFIFIITGISLGLGLFITWFGIPILLGTMYMWIGFGNIERKLSSALLNVKIQYLSPKETKTKSLWGKLKKRITDTSTWKDLGYLIIKFLGIFSFIILVTLISVTLSFIAFPFLYYLTDTGAITLNLCSGAWCSVYNYPVAIFIGVVGIFMIFISLAVFNGLASLSGLIAREILKNQKKR